MQTIALGLIAALAGVAVFAAASAVPASAATQASVATSTTTTTCPVEVEILEYKYSKIIEGTDETTHDEWRFRTRVPLFGEMEVKDITGYDFGGGGQTIVNGHVIPGHFFASAGTHTIPAVVVNAVWGAGGIPDSVLGNGNVNLIVYGGPNVVVAYSAYKVQTNEGYTPYSDWSSWSTVNPGSGTATKEVEHRVVGDGNGVPDKTVYYLTGGGQSDTNTDANWTEDIDPAGYTKIDERDSTKIVDGPCPPVITVTASKICDASAEEYQVLYDGTVNAVGTDMPVEASVGDATPSGSLINGTSGTVELYGAGDLPDYPVGGSFSFLQTNVPGTATSASTTLWYEFEDGTTGTVITTVTLTGDCVNVWEVCTTFSAPTTSTDMSGYPVTDIRDPGAGQINSDQPRSGFGSLMLDTPTTAAKVQYIKPVTPFPLSELIQMEYETFQTTPGVAMGSLQLRFTSVSTGLTGDFNFIAYEPYVDQGNAAIVQNTWQHWDAYRGGDALVWSNRGATLGIASQGAPATFKQINDAVDDIMITGYVINQGSGNAGALSYVDNVGFAKKGEACGVENFEPKPTVVTPTPTGSVEAQCVADPGTGAEVTVTGSNPAPTTPNTVTEDADLEVQVNGVVEYSETVAPGADMAPYHATYPEDSGTYLVELYDVTDPLNPVLLDSDTVDSNCADDVIQTPAKPTVIPPTCDKPGSPGDLHGGSLNRAYDGPGKYTVTYYAPEGQTYEGDKTVSYEIEVLPATGNCGGLANTGVNAAVDGMAKGALLVIIVGLIALAIKRRESASIG